MATSLRTADSAAHPDCRPDFIESTDGELLMRFTKQGDEQALGEILSRHAGMVWAVCRSVLRHDQDAEDAFQATFLILVRRAASVRACDSAAGWLYRVAVRTALAARESRAKRREEHLAEEPPSPETAFPDLHRRRTTAVLMEELNALPDKYQTPLVMRYLEGQTRRSIADLTDTTVATVQGRLARGKRLLRQRLARRGVSLAAAIGVIASSPSSEAATPSNLCIASGGLPQPTLLVQQLASQGVRSMLFATYAKPVAAAVVLALAAVIAAAEDEPATGVSPASEGRLILHAEPSEVEQEATAIARTPALVASNDVNAVFVAAPVQGAATDENLKTREVDALQELVDATRRAWELVQQRREQGEPSGTLDKEAQAEVTYLQALARLEQARGNAEQAIKHYQSAIAATERKIAATQQRYDSGSATLDAVLAALRSRAEAKLELIEAETQQALADQRHVSANAATQRGVFTTDPVYQKLMNRKLKLERDIQQSSAEGLGEKSTQVQRLRSQAEVLGEQLQQYRMHALASQAQHDKTAKVNADSRARDLLVEQLELETGHWELKARALQAKSDAIVERMRTLKGKQVLSDVEVQQNLAEAKLLQAESMLARSKAIELKRRMMEADHAPETFNYSAPAVWPATGEFTYQPPTYPAAAPSLPRIARPPIPALPPTVTPTAPQPPTGYVAPTYVVPDNQAPQYRRVNVYELNEQLEAAERELAELKAQKMPLDPPPIGPSYSPIPAGSAPHPPAAPKSRRSSSSERKTTDSTAPTGYIAPGPQPDSSDRKIQAGDPLILEVKRVVVEERMGSEGKVERIPREVVESIGVAVDRYGFLNGSGKTQGVKIEGKTIADALSRLQEQDPSITAMRIMPSGAPLTGRFEPLISASPGVADQVDAMRKRVEEQSRVIEELQRQRDASQAQQESLVQKLVQAVDKPAPHGPIQPGENLYIQIVSFPEGNEFVSAAKRPIRVGTNGEVALGAEWGRVKIGGMSINDAEQAVRKATERTLTEMQDARGELLRDLSDEQKKSLPRFWFDEVHDVRVQIVRPQPSQP